MEPLYKFIKATENNLPEDGDERIPVRYRDEDDTKWHFDDLFVVNIKGWLSRGMHIEFLQQVTIPDDWEELMKAAIHVLIEYDDKEVQMCTPIAYFKYFDRLRAAVEKLDKSNLLAPLNRNNEPCDPTERAIYLIKKLQEPKDNELLEAHEVVDVLNMVIHADLVNKQMSHSIFTEEQQELIFKIIDKYETGN
jgi:hypothetical protein